MIENRPGQYSPKLEISFRSLSVDPTDLYPSALCEGQVTRKTVENMTQLHAHLSPVADVSTSLHLGDLTTVSSAGRQFAEKGIRISSIDRPDVYPTHLAIKDVLLHLLEKRVHEAIVTVGRRAHNVSSEEKADSKIQQGINIITGQEDFNKKQRIVLRTHTGLWILDGGVTGERLRKSLRGTGVVLAVEIFSANQTQSEYRTLVEGLARDNDWDTPIYFDLDLGHIAEAKFKYRDITDGKEPLALFEEIIAENGRLIAVTSLNQYTDGDHVTHRNFLDPQG